MASIQTPHGEPKFVNEEMVNNYRCKECHDVARKSMQTSCGHRICEACMPSSSFVQDKIRKVPCPAKEVDCEELTVADITPDAVGRKEIRHLQVYCRNQSHGCKEQCRWANLEKHLLVCPFTAMECPNAQQGCREMLPATRMDSHYSECEYHLQNCRHCRRPVPKKFEKEHYQNECTEIPLDCPFGCGMKGLKRSALEVHQDACPNKPEECSFKEIGCKFTGTEREMAKHLQESTSYHLEQVTIYSRKMEIKKMELEHKIQQLIEEQRTLKSETERKGLLTQKLQTESRESKLNMFEVVQRVVHLERKVELFATRDRVDQLYQDIRSNTVGLTQVQSQFVAQNRIMEELKTTVEQRRPGGTREDTTELRRKVTAQETSLTAINVQIGELDLRFQILETTSYDGILLWKIRDYQRRKAEAVAGRTLSLYSQPFFTHRYGYKMCAKVYLNGDGLVNGTHLKLFFVVMKGEFDNLLPWPFKQKVTIQLLDQDSGQTNLTDSFMPDVNSSSFRKPTTDMNVTFGCPLCVKHSVLENPKYIKDDALIFKIIVDTNNLGHP
ncbi:TNF receptor-associated factor 3-like [Dreissena polymorpha]|uniref:TNF receptor-associated factor n=1 Tax=Dreissena polymorpha TaxID=45954 RepID=A0A9D4JIH1_DREPO|nr:TNF receptor-associated factor 3-like [Dreissena polymorpha]KAH3813185.1 hypothetical protein DPMN_141637 [Dreissena polymorpha]